MSSKKLRKVKAAWAGTKGPTWRPPSWGRRQTRGRGPRQEGLDVVAFERTERVEFGKALAEELTKDGERTGELVEGLRADDGGPRLEVGEDAVAHSGGGHRREPLGPSCRPTFSPTRRRVLGHVRLEKQLAQPEQLAVTAPPHRRGQARAALGEGHEGFEVVHT